MDQIFDPLLQHSSTPIFVEEVFMAMPTVGTKAPEFTLPVSREQNVSLKDYQGQKNVVLAFYPLDFTGG
jgi:peroxiredoxin Q/BCP